jgi:KipI family sensor histidine kinase inhibitor
MSERPPFRARPAGDRALLIELGSNAEVHRYAAALRQRLGRELEDIVPGHEAVLVSAAGGAPPIAELERIFDTIARAEVAAAPSPQVTIPVRYDGPDLEQVAAAAGISIAEVGTTHCSREYTAGFIGFSPGFAYLLGIDPTLQLPRRRTPRVTVPRGAVAIAGEYTAVYPSEGPGGWNIIGHTEAVMFDASREESFLVRPGTRVRFEQVS